MRAVAERARSADPDLWLIVGGLLVCVGLAMAWLPLGPIAAGSMIIWLVLHVEPSTGPPAQEPGRSFDALMIQPDEE
jgi:hypothetical protein